MVTIIYSERTCPKFKMVAHNSNAGLPQPIPAVLQGGVCSCTPHNLPCPARGRGLFLHTTQLTLPLLEGGVCSKPPHNLPCPCSRERFVLAPHTTYPAPALGRGLFSRPTTIKYPRYQWSCSFSPSKARQGPRSSVW